MVDEGRKMIEGTITGLIIALTAFVIVNTVIMALTGTSITSKNVFGRIATVFSPGTNSAENAVKKDLLRPFAGDGVTASQGTCHTDSTKWNTSCDVNNLQINCSDVETNGGNVYNFQNLLLARGCTCLTGNTGTSANGADGCYGPATAQCVEHFQAVNNLPLTGALDTLTMDALTSSTSKHCDWAVSNPILAKLPKITSPALNNQGTVNSGCCLVGTSSSNSYCVDGVSANTCDSLSSAANSYAAGQNCATSQQMRHVCGFCSAEPVPPSLPRAFQYATKHWCEEVAHESDGSPLTFNEGTCIGRTSVSSCTSALLLSPLP